MRLLVLTPGLQGDVTKHGDGRACVIGLHAIVILNIDVKTTMTLALIVKCSKGNDVFSVCIPF